MQQPGAVPQREQREDASPRMTPAPLHPYPPEYASPQQAQHGSLPLTPEEPSVRQGEQTQAQLEEGQQERASVRRDQQLRALVDENHQQSARVESDGPDGERVEGDGQERARVRDQEHLPSGAADRQAFGKEVAAATVETAPQELRLRLAALPFEGAEPTSDALEQLAGVAERVLRDPELSVAIEAEFDLPDPEARTVMERRVEAVRAVLVRRGIAPKRLVVRPAGHGPVGPPANSP